MNRSVQTEVESVFALIRMEACQLLLRFANVFQLSNQINGRRWAA